jgi:signal peptide peptidase SppA
MSNTLHRDAHVLGSLHRDAHVLGFALSHPWAIEPSMLAVIADVIGRHVAGEVVDDATMQAALAKRRDLPQPSGGGVAVIPVHGVIAPRANLLTAMSGGTSFESLTGMLNEAMASSKVQTIVLDVDSPGGSVAGATEFASALMAARVTKPIIAVAKYTMGSAAYWLASAATKVYAEPSALVGSIGIYTIHDEVSKALAAKGITRTYISAGKHKVDGNETVPLDGEALAHVQASVDAAYENFLGDIAKGRGVSLASVRNGFGEGRVVRASEALALGMIDGIATLDATIAAAAGGTPTPLSASATPQEPSPATGQEPSRVRQRQEIELALLSL